MRRRYTGAVPLKLALPPDIESRLTGLGDAIAAASPDVQFAYLFGSAATGERSPRSDIDIAVFATPGSDGHGVQLCVARAAARQLGTDAIDIVLLNTAPVSLAGRVLGTRRVILDRDPFTRHQYESATARLFQDFRIREHRLLAERRAHG
jgi:predicted nucleotidyltransferase